MTSMGFKTVQEALSAPRSTHFWFSCRDSKYEAGNRASFFSQLPPDEHLTYDISNNKVLVNVEHRGSIKFVTIFRGDYYADTGHFWPGVWVHRDFTKYGPYSFSIRIGDQSFDLAECNWPYKTSLLGNIFPVTEFSGQQVKATVLTYAPISEDGSIRPRGTIYGLLVDNISAERLTGAVQLPRAFSKENVTSKTIEAGLPCYRDLNMGLLDFPEKTREVMVDLAPGQSLWVPVLLYSYGDPTLEEVDREGSLHWLNSTWAYYRGMTGALSMPEDGFTAEFFERCIHQCFESISMDGTGTVAGSNWGSYPPTLQTWMKDMYHSYLPFHLLEPEFCKKGILWWIKYCLRPKGVEIEGGVRLSIGNALAPALLAGMYYASTADKEFFFQNPGVKEKIQYVLEELLKTCKDQQRWLFSTQYISDGPSVGDFHTGSNLLAWYAFRTFARILEEVYSDRKQAEQYRSIADRIREDLEKNNIIEGPFGKQYIEGVNRDGSIPWMAHDGEESDTTLAPLYGYLDFDNPAYKNYTRFAMSEHNTAYYPITRGIAWGEKPEALYVKATFPGYITGLANVIDRESMVGESGAMTEIRRLTDVDGSLWWWPYAGEQPVYGRPARMNVAGKCGWAAGVFVGLFIDQFLGLKYDAPTRSLSYRPFSPSSSFTWEDFRLGSSRFSAGYSRSPGGVEASISNHNGHEVLVRLELILNKNGAAKKIHVNGKESKMGFERGRFLGRNTIAFQIKLAKGETIRIKVNE
jgi:hypothetical protein